MKQTINFLSQQAKELEELINADPMEWLGKEQKSRQLVVQCCCENQHEAAQADTTQEKTIFKGDTLQLSDATKARWQKISDENKGKATLIASAQGQAVGRGEAPH